MFLRRMMDDSGRRDHGAVSNKKEVPCFCQDNSSQCTAEGITPSYHFLSQCNLVDSLRTGVIFLYYLLFLLVSICIGRMLIVIAGCVIKCRGQAHDCGQPWYMAPGDAISSCFKQLCTCTKVGDWNVLVLRSYCTFFTPVEMYMYVYLTQTEHKT